MTELCPQCGKFLPVDYVHTQADWEKVNAHFIGQHFDPKCDCGGYKEK